MASHMSARSQAAPCDHEMEVPMESRSHPRYLARLRQFVSSLERRSGRDRRWGQ